MSATLVETVLGRDKRKLGRKARKIVLDFDPTDDPTHGQQEFTFFHGYYNTYCYLPVIGTHRNRRERESCQLCAALARDQVCLVLARYLGQPSRGPRTGGGVREGEAKRTVVGGMLVMRATTILLKRRARPSGVWDMWSRRAPCLALAALLVLPGCGGDRAPEHRIIDRTPEHLILVTIDTLRRDHLGSYGFPGQISPHLDRLAERGVRFDDALAQSISTPPSHASVLTGLNPQRHGLRKLFGGRLAASNRTLAEVLQEAGFETAAFVSAVPLRREAGLDQGFSVYDGTAANQPERRASATNASVRRWLDSRSPAGRLFLWVHYFDPHFPYLPPREYREVFGQGDAQAGDLMLTRNANPDTGTVQVASPDAVKRTRDLYAAEVHYSDAAVGELMTLLEKHDILADAAIAVVSDHGECLGENGYYFGHWDVFEETARIPMILAHPYRFQGRVVAPPVATIDLMPTLLAWLGLEVSDSLDGIDLTPMIEGAPGPERTIYTEQLEYFPARAVRNHAWTWIVRPGSESGELRARGDVLRELGDVEIRLAAALRVFESAKAPHPSPQIEVPESVAEQLRDLGYVE